MQKNLEQVTFLCAKCHETFEFYQMREYKLVSCPICGIDYITIKENQTLTLQNFEQLDQRCNQ